MVSFLEICRRAATGPIVAPDDFDMGRFVPNLRAAIKKHNLQPPPKDVVVPWDESARSTANAPDTKAPMYGM